jgi:ABC-2 type transport system ATP-binding protein
LLKIIGLKKTYDGEVILDIPNFELEPGIFWIQGENGAGKTTFLKILAGIIPYEGKIILEEIGEERENRNEYRRSVNFAEAEPSFPKFLNGNELICFYVKTKGDNEYARDLIQKFGLLEYSAKKIKSYSSGMLKKLSLVLGLIGKPHLLLFDEPLITLDATSLLSFLEVLKKWVDENKMLTVIFTSHQAPDLDQIPIKGIIHLGEHAFLSPKQ